MLGVSARTLVVVIGDVADHLEGMLIGRQHPVPLHRHGAPGNRMGVEHASNFRPRRMHRARHREPAAVISASEGSTLLPSALILTSDDAVISSNRRP